MIEITPAERLLRGFPVARGNSTSALDTARDELASLLSISPAAPSFPGTAPDYSPSPDAMASALLRAIAMRDEAGINRTLHHAQTHRSDDERSTWQFLDEIAVLAYPPHGAAAVLLRASRLGAGTLGPYLRNVHRLLPDPAHVIALAGSLYQDLPRPIALLACSLDPDALRALVDALADLGLLAAIGGLLGSAVRAGRAGNFAPLWAVRDAALDLGDRSLAISTQRTVARLRPDIALEIEILGRMMLSAGHSEDAAAIFDAAGRTKADYHAMPAVDRGFGTDPARQRRRFALRF